MILFEKEYDGESLYDLGRDISEVFDPAFSSNAEKLSQDEHGFVEGRIIVKIVVED